MTNILISGFISFLIGILTFVIQNLLREIYKLNKEKNNNDKSASDALKNGLKCLLRSQLIEYYNEYINDGKITSNQYENWMEMYKSYKELGGNGMITHMSNDIEELIIKK